MFVFRKSTLADIDEMVRIAEAARALLKSRGVAQWQRGTYPDRALFVQDVAEGIGYVVSEGPAVVAICAVTLTEEAAYRDLFDGAWLTADGALYATIHRGAVAPEHQGRRIPKFLFDAAADLAREKGAVSLRADTHPDNAAMQRALERAGFQRCGKLILLRGDERGDLRYGYERLV